MAEKESPQENGNGDKRADIQRRSAAESDRISELRERLYARGPGISQSTRHSLAKERPVPKEVTGMAHTTPHVAPTEPKPAVSEPKAEEMRYSEAMPQKSKRATFRKTLALSGVAFFVIAVGVASMLMFWGNNTISGNNISIQTDGPISVGGGEELNFQVAIANQNAVPIQSATLIVEYPQGTKSATEREKELTIERLQLDTIDSGELVNVPLKAVIYGEEDEEQEIRVRIEYRVEGSNATFEKRSAPLAFKISTSPVVITFDSVDRISSGQELELTLDVQSNSPTTLSNLLVKASYPAGFEYTSSEPDTVSGQDTWSINELKPNETKTIVIKGIVTGGENELQTFDAQIGVASERDRNVLVSQLANARTEITIEQPFLDVTMEVNGSLQETVVINERSKANIVVNFRNTLENAIYDGKVVVELGGNALDEYEVDLIRGFYDSNKNTITWDGTEESSLREILPGDRVTLRFGLDPDNDVGGAPELTVKATFTGERRVFSATAPQQLVGITEKTIKIESVPTIDAEILYGSGPFTNTGPVPPIAEQVTQYTYAIKVSAGVNDLTDAEVSAVLPQYINWLDLTDGDGTVTYNATTRTMTWRIGNIAADETKEFYAQVSLRPSLSQVKSAPTILGTQRFRATDRYTGTTIRSESPALTTNLYNESDDDLEDGKVREPG